MLHNQLAEQRVCDVLQKEVVGLTAFQVDAEEQSERAGHEDLFLVQLEH